MEKWEECTEPCPGNVGLDIQGFTQNGICLALMFTGGRGQGYFNGWNIIPNEGTFKYDMIIFQLLENKSCLIQCFNHIIYEKKLKTI